MVANLEADSLIAQSMILDSVIAAVGVEKIEITASMVHSAINTHS